MLENIVAQIKKYEQNRNKKITLAMLGVLFSMLSQMTEQQYLAISPSSLKNALSLLLHYKSDDTSPDLLLRHCEQVISLIDRLHRYHAGTLVDIENPVKSYLIELQRSLGARSIKEDSQLDWRNDIQHLLTVREEAMRTPHVLNMQIELTKKHFLILRKMFKRAELILGVPGFRYTIMCLGPLSRGDASTSLALQCHALIEGKTPANYAYIDDLFAVVQCELLGVDKTVIDLVVYPTVQAAEHLQGSGIVTIESGIQAIEDNCKQAIDHADAKCLYGDEELLHSYQQALNQALSSAERKIKETLLQTGQIFKTAPWQQDLSATRDIDLVHECLMPLCNAIVQLRHYYRVTDLSAHPLMLVNTFINRGHWSEEFGNACRNGLNYLYQLELQQATNKNRDHRKQNQGMGWQRILMTIIEKMLKPMGLMMLWLGEVNAQAELFNLIKKSREKQNNHTAQTMIGMTLDFLRSSRAEELKSLPKQMLIELVQEFIIQSKQWKLHESVLMNNYRLLVMLVEKISDLQPQDTELLVLQMKLKLRAGLYFTLLAQRLSDNSGERLMTDDFLNIYFGMTNLVEVRTWLEENPLQNKAAMTQNEIEGTIEETIEQKIDSAMQKIYATVARSWKQNVPTSATHWRNYRQSLQQLRQQLNAQSRKGFAIEDLHAVTAKGAMQREQRMLEQCSLYLGRFSGIMIILKLGSGSKRGDPTAFSDTECAVVYQEDPNPAQHQQQEEYIHDLLWLWQFEMMLLGESDKKHAGVHLDLPPRIEIMRDQKKPRKKFAVVTVYSYIDWVKKAFYEDYTRLIPTLLYSSDSRGNQLFDSLMQHLRPYPDLPMQQEFLHVVNIAFRSACWNQSYFAPFGSVNIKTDFLRPLILGITQLTFYYEIKDIPSHHPLQLLQLLIDRGCLAKDYGGMYKSALELLYKIRDGHQLTHGVQSEDRKEVVLWVPQFQQIIDEVLKPFQVLLKAMGDGLAKDDLVTLHPWNFPDKRGVRLSVTMAERQWQQQIKDELVTDRPNSSLPLISIKTAEGFAGFFPEEVVRFLLERKWIDRSGQFIFEAKETSENVGTHLTHHVKTKNASFFFKIFPLQFMQEFYTGNMGDLLEGKRSKYSCTPKVEIANIEANGVVYVVTISEPIGGEDAEKKFRMQQANDLILEKRGFGGRAVLEMNVNPGDNQPQNDKVVISFNPYTQKNEARYICVDNEVNGGPSVTQNKEGEVKVATVSHMYCASDMNTTFNQSLAYELGHIDPYLLLMHLLDICERKEQQIRRIFTEKQIRAFFKESPANILRKRMGLKTDVPESSLLVMPLRENVMEESFLGLTRMLKLIKDPNIKYLKLLCLLDPYVGNFYKKLHDKYDTVESRFNNGPALLYEQNKKASKTGSASSAKGAAVSAHQTKVTKLLSLRTAEGKPAEIEKLLNDSSIAEARERLRRVEQQYRNLNTVTHAILEGNADVIKELEQLDSHDLRERIINQLDFSQIKSGIDKILKMMTKIRFCRLRIINCDALTDEILEKILKNSPGLEELTLRNCRNVGKKDLFQMLSQRGKMLVAVHLDGLPSLIVREERVHVPVFERLRELSIQNCVNLNTLILQADELRLLQLGNLNPALSYQLQLPKLTTLDLSAWHNFREDDLKAMTGNITCESLTTIKFSADCTINSQQMTLLKKCPLFIRRRIYNLSADSVRTLLEILDSTENYTHLLNDFPKETMVALSANKSIKMAHVAVNDVIDEEYMKLVASMLRLNTTFSSVTLSYLGEDRTTLINISSLMPVLQLTLSLQSLCLYGVNMGDVGAVNIAKVLRDRCALFTLSLSYCNIGANGAAALAEALPFNTTLKAIDLSSNEVTTEGAFALGRAFLVNTTLTSINLYSQNSYHGIGVDGAILYARLLDRSSTLIRLNLGGPGLSSAGIEVVARAMVHNRVLRILELPNVIGGDASGDPPFLPFADVVRRNNALLTLDLSDNQRAMGKEAIEIARALIFNTTLTRLNLHSNYNLYHAHVEFARALEKNNTLLDVDLSTTYMDIEGCKAMARMLEIQTSLTSIHLSGGEKKDNKSKLSNVKFGEEGTRLLIQSLQQNRSLTSFDYFNGNNIVGNVPRDITVLLTLNPRLVYLPLVPNMEQYCEMNINHAASMRRAIFEKDARQVSNYLSQGISIFALDNSSGKLRNILQLIAISGDLSVLRFLLELLQREKLSIKGMILLSYYENYYEKLTAIDFARLFGHHKIAAILERCLASNGNKIDIARIFADVNMAYPDPSTAVAPAADIPTAYIPGRVTPAAVISTAFIPVQQALPVFQSTPGMSATLQQAIPTIRATSQNASLTMVNNAFESNSSAKKTPLSGKEKMLAALALTQRKAQEYEVTPPVTLQNVPPRGVNQSPVKKADAEKPPVTDREKMLAALNRLVTQTDRRVDQHDQLERDDQEVQDAGDVEFLSDYQEIPDIGEEKFFPHALSAIGTQFFPEVQDDKDAEDVDFRPDELDDEIPRYLDFKPDDQDEMVAANTRKYSTENSEAQYIPFAVQMERDDPFSASHQKPNIDKITKVASIGKESRQKPSRDENNSGSEIRYKFAMPLSASLPVLASATASPTKASPPTALQPYKSPLNNAGGNVVGNAGGGVIGNVVINAGSSVAVKAGDNVIGNAAVGDDVTLTDSAKKRAWATVVPRAAATKSQPSLGIAQPVDRTGSSLSLNASSAIQRAISEQDLSLFDASPSLIISTVIPRSLSSSASAEASGTTSLNRSSPSPSLTAVSPSPSVMAAPVPPPAAASLAPTVVAAPAPPIAATTPTVSWSPITPKKPIPTALSEGSRSVNILGSRGSAGKPSLPEIPRSDSPKSVAPTPVLQSALAPKPPLPEKSLPTTPTRMLSKPSIPKSPLPATPPKGSNLSTVILSPAKPAASVSQVSPAAASPATSSSLFLPAQQASNAPLLSGAAIATAQLSSRAAIASPGVGNSSVVFAGLPASQPTKP